MEGNDEMCTLPRSPIMEGRLEVTRLQAGDQLGKYFNHPYKKEGLENGNSDGSCKTWSNW